MGLERHEHVRALVEAGVGWHTIEHHAEVTSTNDVAHERLLAGTPPGIVVVGDRQTAGRGRAGRPWEDGPDPESSLMLTAGVRAPDRAVGLVPLVAGLAVADALDDHLGPDVGTPGLKWPNDVLIDHRKLAGVLVERRPLGANWVLLVGIGVDVDWRGADRSGDRAAWTSIAEETGAPVDRGALLAAVLQHLARLLQTLDRDPAPVLERYRTRCVSLGRAVAVSLPGGQTLTGHARDVGDDGRLLVDTDHELVAINAGDIVHVRSA